MELKLSKSLEARGQAIIERSAQGAVVIEVGTLVGHLALYVASQRPDIRWVMVDNWLPRSSQPAAYVATGDDHALHDQRRANRNRQRALKVAHQIGAVVMDGNSTDIAARVAQGSADLVFIDADHSFEGCRADIAAWRGAVRKSGWIGGHDYHNPDPRFSGVDRAVDEAFPRGVNKGPNYTWWARS